MPSLGLAREAIPSQFADRELCTHRELERGRHRNTGEMSIGILRRLSTARQPDLSPLWQRLVGGREESGEGLCGGAFQLGKHLTSDLKNAARAWVAVGAPVTGTTLF